MRRIEEKCSGSGYSTNALLRGSNRAIWSAIISLNQTTLRLRSTSTEYAPEYLVGVGYSVTLFVFASTIASLPTLPNSPNNRLPDASAPIRRKTALRVGIEYSAISPVLASTAATLSERRSATQIRPL